MVSGLHRIRTATSTRALVALLVLLQFLVAPLRLPGSCKQSTGQACCCASSLQEGAPLALCCRDESRQLPPGGGDGEPCRCDHQGSPQPVFPAPGPTRGLDFACEGTRAAEGEATP